jgi:HEPN domain-containing protein
MNEKQLAESWILRAKSSLLHAQEVSQNGDIFFEDLCFDCQQATEKSIKAVMISSRVTPPRTHNIGFLLDHLVASGVDVPIEIYRSSRLTEYAVTTRYPGAYEPVLREEYLEALNIAEIVVTWASILINSQVLD